MFIRLSGSSPNIENLSAIAQKISIIQSKISGNAGLWAGGDADGPLGTEEAGPSDAQLSEGVKGGDRKAPLKSPQTPL